jgi:hypothetical protein
VVDWPPLSKRVLGCLASPDNVTPTNSCSIFDDLQRRLNNGGWRRMRGRHGKPRLRRSFALPAPGSPMTPPSKS